MNNRYLSVAADAYSKWSQNPSSDPSIRIYNDSRAQFGVSADIITRIITKI